MGAGLYGNAVTAESLLYGSIAADGVDRQIAFASRPLLHWAQLCDSKSVIMGRRELLDLPLYIALLCY